VYLSVNNSRHPSIHRSICPSLTSLYYSSAPSYSLYSFIHSFFPSLTYSSLSPPTEPYSIPSVDQFIHANFHPIHFKYRAYMICNSCEVPEHSLHSGVFVSAGIHRIQTVLYGAYLMAHPTLSHLRPYSSHPPPFRETKPDRSSLVHVE
jgi:hypothetical protein